MSEWLFITGWILSGLIGSRIHAHYYRGLSIPAVILGVIGGYLTLFGAGVLFLSTITIWKD